MTEVEETTARHERRRAYQRLWKFTEDPSFHRFWEYPKCECPRFDNMDRLGYPGKVMNTDCPLHGDD